MVIEMDLGMLDFPCFMNWVKVMILMSRCIRLLSRFDKNMIFWRLDINFVVLELLTSFRCLETISNVRLQTCSKTIA